MANKVEISNPGAVTCTFTPGAAAHGALDALGAAQKITIPSGAGRLIKWTGYRFNLATTTPITTVYTLFLFKSTPTVIADNDPFVIAAADGALLLGKIAIAQPVDFTSTWQESEALIAGQYMGPLETDTITAYLQATSGVTTEAVAFTARLFYELL